MNAQINVDGTPVNIFIKQIEKGLFEVSGVYDGVTVIVNDPDYQVAVEKWMRSVIQASKQEIFKQQ